MSKRGAPEWTNPCTRCETALWETHVHAQGLVGQVVEVQVETRRSEELGPQITWTTTSDP